LRPRTLVALEKGGIEMDMSFLREAEKAMKEPWSGEMSP
jgi:hypothetical protein